MKKERTRFSLGSLNEATIRIPKKLNSLQEKTKKAQDDLKRLSSEVVRSTLDIVLHNKTSGNRYLDIAIVLANSLYTDPNPQLDLHQDKTLEAVSKIYSRLTELDVNLKANPGTHILLDRTNEKGRGLFLDFGEINSSPSINYAIKDYPSFRYRTDIPIKVILNGYRRLKHVDEGWRAPILFSIPNPNYHEQWYSENITDFFTLSPLSDYDYNGLKKDLWREPTGHVGGIFIGDEAIAEHLGQMKNYLDKNYKGIKINIDKF